MMNVVIGIIGAVVYLSIGLAIGIVAELGEVGSFGMMFVWPIVILAFIVLCLYEAIYNGFCNIYKFLRNRWKK